LEGTNIFGISTFDLQTDGCKQENLIITRSGKAIITVDNLEVAHLIHLILTQQKVRDLIGTIPKKGVLILGRCTPERNGIIDTIRLKLREHDFVPIMFDFEKARAEDFNQSIKILATLSRFVIADITNPKSIPQELKATVSDFQIPFLPIVQKGEDVYSMFEFPNNYQWVLKILQYDNKNDLMKRFNEEIIEKALLKEKEILEEKNKAG
jgi:hypothetical protein